MGTLVHFCLLCVLEELSAGRGYVLGGGKRGGGSGGLWPKGD